MHLRMQSIVFLSFDVLLMNLLINRMNCTIATNLLLNRLNGGSRIDEHSKELSVFDMG